MKPIKYCDHQGFCGDRKINPDDYTVRCNAERCNLQCNKKVYAQFKDIIDLERIC